MRAALNNQHKLSRLVLLTCSFRSSTVILPSHTTLYAYYPHHRRSVQHQPNFLDCIYDIRIHIHHTFQALDVGPSRHEHHQFIIFFHAVSCYLICSISLDIVSRYIHSIIPSSSLSPLHHVLRHVT